MTVTEHTSEAAGSWDLVTACQAGDREAFARLYRDYAPAVSGFVRGRLRGDHHLAEDLTSETFLRALRRIDTAHNTRGRDVGAWLTTIARNLVTDHYKSARTRYERVLEELPEPRGAEARQAYDVTPESRVVGKFDRDAAAVTVTAAMAGLTPNQRQAIELYELAPQRDLAATAAQMGRQVGAVKALRHRAVRAMSERLAADGLTSSEQCARAVGRARRAVDELAPHDDQPPAVRVPAVASADRWADVSVAAAVEAVETAGVAGVTR